MFEISGLLSPAHASAQDADAPAGIAPTAEAVETLEHINRLRADPAAEAFEIAALGRRAYDIPAYVDLAMFVDELLAAEPVPPLVFDPLLVEAATRHSEYMIEHGQGHTEEPGRRHFTGERHAERIAAAGYDAFVSGENVFVAALNAHQGHIGFVIDWGWEDHPGGMQPNRGHRKNLLLRHYTQVGVAVLPWHEEAFGRDLWSVTHKLAAPRVYRRFVGGVVYTDRNRNGRFDAGEGEAGVTLVASDGSETMTWDSGAYTLALAGPGAVTVTASVADGVLRRVFEVPAGDENVKRDWVLPGRVDPQAVARAVALCGGVDAENGAMFRRARQTLWVLMRDYAVPESLAEDAAGFTEGLGEAVSASRQRVLDALLDAAVEGSETRALIAEERRVYANSSLAGWYTQAEAARRVLVSAEQRSADLAPDADPTRRRRALRTLYRQLEHVTDPALRGLVVPVLRP